MTDTNRQVLDSEWCPQEDPLCRGRKHRPWASRPRDPDAVQPADRTLSHEAQVSHHLRAKDVAFGLHLQLCLSGPRQALHS